MQAKKSQTVAKKTLIWNQISGLFLFLQQVCKEKKTLPKKSPPLYSVLGKNKIVPNWHHMWGSVLWLDTLNGSPRRPIPQYTTSANIPEAIRRRTLSTTPLSLNPQILQTPGSQKKLLVRFLDGHSLIRPPHSGEECAGERVHQGGWESCGWSQHIKRGEWGHRGVVPEQGGPDRGQGNLKQRKILRQYQSFAYDRFASNALVRCNDILCFSLQGRDLFGPSIKVLFVDVTSVVFLAGWYNGHNNLLYRRTQSETHAPTELKISLIYTVVYIFRLLTFSFIIETLTTPQSKVFVGTLKFARLLTATVYIHPPCFFLQGSCCKHQCLARQGNCCWY